MPRRKISVLILFNSPKPSKGGQAFVESEAGVLAEVEAVGRALERLRIPHRMAGIRWFHELPVILAAADEPVVFNLVEGFWADSEQANMVPAVVHSFGKACTGNDTPGLIASLDKWQSKTLLRAAGLPTPKGLIVHPGRPIPAQDLFDGPYIVKPIRADASEGIDNASIVRKRGGVLREAVQRIHERFGQPALIEQYIDGRELNVSVIWRDGEPHVLPLAEIDFSAFDATRPRIVGYEAKWLADTFEYHHTPRIIPAPLSKPLARRIRDLAMASCRTLGCFDYCRVDFRLDKAGNPYVLEVNANPDISPDAGFAAALEAAGISYEAFVKLTVDNAERKKRDERTKTVGRIVHRPSSIVSRIRWCRPEDRQAVLTFLAQTGFFRPDEMDIAREVLDEALAQGPKGHYQSFVACMDKEVVGWVCFGPTPCTIGSFDIYWIGVASAWQGRGIGRALMEFAEQAIAQRGGRLLVVETSSREKYLPTRRFYEALGYTEAAQIREFYGPEDHKVIFTKALRHTS